MIVVVIIGILAAVAIPSYQGFQEKAKSTEAKVQLSAIYMAEKTYFVEYDRYLLNLADIGIPASPLKHYEAVGFSDFTSGVGAVVINSTTGAPEYGIIKIPISFASCSISLSSPSPPMDRFRACALKTNTDSYTSETDWNIDHNRNIQQELSPTIWN